MYFCPFWSEIGYGLEGNFGSVGTFLSFQFQISKKEKGKCEFEMDLENFFCLRPNLSNDNIIPGLRPGLKTGMDLRGLV